MTTRIDRKGKLPIYHQVAQSLQQRIARQEWNIGEKLPSETDLADAYKVSRVTVRQALTGLEKENIVVRSRPHGTFVQRVPEMLSPTIGMMVDITASLREAGHATEITTLGMDIVFDVADEAKEFLGAQDDQGFVIIRRLITVDQSPFAWIQNNLSLARFPDLAAKGLKNNSVRQTLLDRYGLTTGSSDHWIQVTKATLNDVNLLNVAPNSTLMKLDTAFMDQNNEPMVFMCTRLVTDQMRLHLRPTSSDSAIDHGAHLDPVR